MQQRISSSSSRDSGECRAINVAEQLQPKRRWTADEDGTLPLYDPRSAIGKREISRSRLSRKWVHTIPALVLFSFFVLWWFSSPVNVVFKDGRIIAVSQVHSSLPNNTLVDLTILAVAASPLPSFPGIDFTILAAAASPPLPSFPGIMSSSSESEMHLVSSPS